MTTDTMTMNSAITDEHEHHDAVAIRAFGFWLYLMTDLVLFSMIFATFAVLGRNYAGGPTGKDLYNLAYTFGETMCLLFSSASCGMAMLAMHNDKKVLALTGFIITFLLGLGFISMEINEFLQMIQEGNGPGRSGFLSAFFTLIGTHGVHVFFGLIWMAVMMGQIVAGGLTMPVRSRLMRLGMFWHFLDIVWIGIFTFVYLMGVM